MTHAVTTVLPQLPELSHELVMKRQNATRATGPRPPVKLATAFYDRRPTARIARLLNEEPDLARQTDADGEHSRSLFHYMAMRMTREIRGRMASIDAAVDHAADAVLDGMALDGVMGLDAKLASLERILSRQIAAGEDAYANALLSFSAVGMGITAGAASTQSQSNNAVHRLEEDVARMTQKHVRCESEGENGEVVCVLDDPLDWETHGAEVMRVPRDGLDHKMRHLAVHRG
jgi:microcompartment protein CcmL/EutN